MADEPVQKGNFAKVAAVAAVICLLAGAILVVGVTRLRHYNPQPPSSRVVRSVVDRAASTANWVGSHHVE